MLTRGQVAERIGRSIATVRRMEGRRLHPRVNERGTHLFDAEEVERVAEEIQTSGRALDQQPVLPDANAPNWDDFDALSEELTETRERLKEALESHAELANRLQVLGDVLSRFRRTGTEQLQRLDEACYVLVLQIDEPSELTELATTTVRDALTQLGDVLKAQSSSDSAFPL